jgi:tetratricopeptide (TPR) repeat protein
LSTIEIFFSYSHKDEKLRNRLETQLSLLKQQGHITNWYDRKIDAGQEWANKINEHLNAADIILLLVSPDYLASDYCYSIEMKKALERHEQGEAKVIPVILRPVHWRGALFGKLQALPTDAIPVTSSKWHNLDEAFYNVAEGINRAIQELMTSFEISADIKKSQEIPSTKAALRTPLQDTPLKQVQKSKEQWLKEGSLLLNLKRYAEALAAYEQAIRLDPNHAAAYREKGYALSRLKRYAEALAAYEQAIRLDPNDAVAYANKGGVLSNLKLCEEALAAYEQAIRLDPNHESAYTNKGYALQKLGREKEAQQAFEKALQLGYGG